MAQLMTKMPITEDVTEFTFDITDSGFWYQPGQYVTLTLVELHGQPLPVKSRDFSIASAPHDHGRLQIVARRSDSLFKTALFALSPGDSVMLTGPKGVMVLPETSLRPLICIAAGIGITPFLSIVRYASAKNSGHRITIYHCIRSSDDILYQEELALMTAQAPDMVVRPIYGRSRLERMLPSIVGAAESQAVWYLAGPPKMVTGLRRLLQESDIIGNRILWEGFTGYGRRLY